MFRSGSDLSFSGSIFNFVLGIDGRDFFACSLIHEPGNGFIPIGKTKIQLRDMVKSRRNLKPHAIDGHGAVRLALLSGFA